MVPVPTPSWLQVDADVVHRVFGTGRVVDIAPIKGALVVFVEFDRGDVVALDPEWVGTDMRPRRWWDLTTRVRRSIRCDVCHGRPVVVTVAGPRAQDCVSRRLLTVLIRRQSST
jgi:hypothetical protein